MGWRGAGSFGKLINPTWMFQKTFILRGMQPRPCQTHGIPPAMAPTPGSASPPSTLSHPSPHVEVPASGSEV